MKITFYGTGASEGFPALFCECDHCMNVRKMEPKNFRTRSSCLIDETLLVDFSADTYAHCLYGKLDLTKVRNILVTHSHNDHFYPQDLCKIMPPYARHQRIEPLFIHGNEHVEKAFIDGGGLNPKLQPYLQFKLLKPFETYNIGSYQIMPVPANHAPGENCLLYIIKDNKKVLLYGHDSGYFRDEAWDALKKFHFDAVILDCTSGGEECPYPTHMGIPDNIRVRNQMYELKIANEKTIFIITHFAHSFGPYYDRMEHLASENGFIAAYDGFQIEF